MVFKIVRAKITSPITDSGFTMLKWRKRNGVIQSEDVRLGLSFFIIPKNGKYALHINNWGIQTKGTKQKCKKFADKVLETKMVKSTKIKILFEPRIRYQEKNKVFIEHSDYTYFLGVKHDPLETDHETSLRHEFKLTNKKYPNITKVIELGRSLYQYNESTIKSLFTKKEKVKVTCSNPKPIRDPPLKSQKVVHTCTSKVPKLKNSKWKTVRRWARKILNKGLDRNEFITIGALCNLAYRQNKGKVVDKIKAIYSEEYEKEKRDTRKMISKIFKNDKK